MKKFLALLLVAVTVFALCAIPSAAADVPAEPTLTSDKKVYAGWNKNGTGATPDDYMKSTGWVEGGAFNEAVKDGAKVVIVDKIYAGATTDFPTNAPVLFTGVDGDTSYISRNADGKPEVMDDAGANFGQLGMFMLANSITLNINNVVIFDNTVILNRLNAASVADGKAYGTFNVRSGASLVITSTVEFAEMSGEVNYNLSVEEGGYAYLHAAGFESYAGKGTIVLDKALVDNGTVTKDTFAGFEGAIVAQDGSDPFAAPAVTDAPPAVTDAPVADTTVAPSADTTAPVTQTPTTDAPATADFGIISIILSAVSLAAAAIIVTKKVKEN